MTTHPIVSQGPRPVGEAPDRVRQFDVAVVGSHLTTNLLATILAHHGVSVALIDHGDAASAPTDDNTVPYTAELFYLLGSRYGVPEIADMGMFSRLPAEVRRTSGVKQNLGFLYHHRGQAHRPEEALQFNVPGEHAEWHLYRPDVDAYTRDLARRYGVTVITDGVTELDRAGERPTLRLADDSVVQAACVLDASVTPLVEPAGRGARHASRVLSTHMHGVRPFEEIRPLHLYEQATAWSRGTLLHAFDGGWIRIVPFGNHEGGVNSLTAVTVCLDPDRFPATGATPDEEFQSLLALFPDIRLQFAAAARVRPWHVDDAWAGLRDAGDGAYVLFDRGAARHDFIFGRELTMGLELVNAAAATILGARSRLDAAALRPLRDYQRRLFDYHDRVVAASRTATRSFELWNATLRMWLLWSILSALALKRARLDGEATGDWAPATMLDRGPFWFAVPAGLPELLDELLGDVESTGTRKVPPSVAAGRMFRRMRRSKIAPPLYDFGKPEARYYHFTKSRRLRMLLWVKTTAPADFRRLLTADNVTAVPDETAGLASAQR
jgi:FADH2 O2-dependent halogenase